MKLLCLGDSLTYGYDVPLALRWTTVVAQELGITIDNEGVCGDTTAGMVYRLQFLKLSDYDGFFLMGGSNDVLMDTPVDQTKRHLSDMAATMARTGKPVVLGIPPLMTGQSALFGWQRTSDVSRHNEMLRELGGYIQALCREKEYYPISFAAVMTDESLYADGVHPNSGGYGLVAQAAGKVFRNVFELS